MPVYRVSVRPVLRRKTIIAKFELRSALQIDYSDEPIDFGDDKESGSEYQKISKRDIRVLEYQVPKRRNVF